MTRASSLDAQAAPCPKCSKPRLAGADECPYCGIVFARFRVPPAAPRAVKIARTPFVAPARVEALLRLLAATLESGATLQSLGRGEALLWLPRPIAERIWMDADLGVPLTTSLAALELLDEGSLAILRAKEAHGALPSALRQVAERLEARRRRRWQVLLALAYPVGMVLAASAILPLPVLVRCGIWAYLRQASPAFLGVAALGALGLFFFPRLRPGHPARRGLGYLLTALPIARSALLDAALSTFADALGAGLGAGIPMREAVARASEAASHPAFAGAARRAVAGLDAGLSLARALALSAPFPPQFLEPIAVAEQTGTLEGALANLAQERERRAKRMALLGLALVTGAVALGVAALLGWRIAEGWSAIWNDQARLIDSLSR